MNNPRTSGGSDKLSNRRNQRLDDPMKRQSSRFSFLAPFKFSGGNLNNSEGYRTSTSRRSTANSFHDLEIDDECKRPAASNRKLTDSPPPTVSASGLSSDSDALPTIPVLCFPAHESALPRRLPPLRDRDEGAQDASEHSLSINSDIMDTDEEAQRRGGRKKSTRRIMEDDENLALAAAEEAKRQSRFYAYVALGSCAALLIVVVIVAALASSGSLSEGASEGDTTKDAALIPTIPPVGAPTVATPSILPTVAPEQNDTPGASPIDSMLRRIQQRGILRCGIVEYNGFALFDSLSGTYQGIDADLCRAVAAAIFGVGDDPSRIADFLHERVEFVALSPFNRFKRLAEESFDMMSAATTHTMEREVYEPSSRRGFDFSVPYLYDGLQFAGLAEYVKCAETQSSDGGCANTVICVLDGSTHLTIVKKRNPSVKILAAKSNAQIHLRFIEGRCNVIAGEQASVSESSIRESGYTGVDYVVGSLVLSKEPLCVVTRNDDAQWSDFVNWVVQAMLAAEEEGILQRTAGLLPLTTLFGNGLERIFAASVRAVGNYAEVYQRNLQAIATRQNGNTINQGASGLVYSFPLGDTSVVGPGPTIGGMIERILNRGFLKCGISERPMFAFRNGTDGKLNGFDVDYCKALSAALFEGETDMVEYMDLSASARFVSLGNGSVDVLSRVTTHTFGRDVLESTSGVGFSFSHPNFYDGMTFGGVPEFAQCADRLDVTSLNCRDMKICVEGATTFETIMKSLFPPGFLYASDSAKSIYKDLDIGNCNVIAGGVGDVATSVVRLAGYLGEYAVGANRYSKDPLALVTRQDDPQWTCFVNWVVDVTFFADEEGITKEDSDRLPQVHLFGEGFLNMFRNTISAVGSYGEIYERSIESEIPRSGLNFLNAQLAGPQHYPLPGIV